MSDIIIFAISLLVIYQSSRWVVNSAVRISDVFNLSKLAVGFLFLAVCTSLPELFISTISSITNNTPLAIGNIMGANVTDVTLAIAATVLLGGTIFLKTKEVRNLHNWILISSIIILFIFASGELSLIHGIILIAIFVGFSIYTFESKPTHMHGEAGIIEKIILLAEFGGGAVLLLIASNWLVTSASNIAVMFGISSAVIGATIISFGTTIPEISVAIHSVIKKEYEMVIGDLVGSVIINSTLLLGLAALWGNSISTIKMVAALPALLAAFILIAYLSRKNKKFSIGNSLIFLAIYSIFIIAELTLL